MLNLIIKSQDIKSVFKFYFLAIKSTSVNKIFIKVFSYQVKTLLIALLRSPHVNKTAQEHFEKQNYSIKLQILILKKKECVMFLKQLNTGLLPNLEIRICISSSRIYRNKNFKQTYDPYIFVFEKYLKNDLIKILSLFKLLSQKQNQQYKKTFRYYFLEMGFRLEKIVRIMDVFGASIKTLGVFK